MNRKATHFLRLGLFVSVGLALFIIAIYYIGAKNNLIGKTITLRGIFTDVSGLRIGNNVRYSGINVGTVTDISLANDSLVLVEMSVEKNMQQVIRKDSRLAIGSEGVMGNKIMSVTPGTPNAPTINHFDTLPTVETVKFEAILFELKKSSQNATQITENLVAITHKINRGEGIFGKLFSDTVLSNNLTRISLHTANLTRDFSHISEKLNQEEGAFGKLLTDSSVGMQLETITSDLAYAITDLRKVMHKLEQGESLFGKILTDTAFSANLNTMSANLQYTLLQSRQVADNLEIISTEMVKGRGLVNRLLLDTAFADSIETTVQNINQTAKELEEAAKKVKSNWFIRSFSRKE
ncbi:MAG: MlaD family protein [Bacteroidales bacterium]